MSGHAHPANDPTDVPSRKNPVRKRQPVIVVLLVTLFASIAVMTAVLMVPIVWVAMTEAVERPAPASETGATVRK